MQRFFQNSDALDKIMAHSVFSGVENMQPAVIDSAAAKEVAGSQAHDPKLDCTVLCTKFLLACSLSPSPVA